MNRIVYRKLRKYKYQLLEDHEEPIDIQLDADIETPFVRLSKDGVIWIRREYSWDGPSGPTLDTKTFMRGSLIHDSLYQLMRLSKLDHTKHRKQADAILRKICIDDGMMKLRAWYVYRSVRLFGGKSARPRSASPTTRLYAP
jgi:hypothetical protein